MANCDPILALISGNVDRMWCIKIYIKRPNVTPTEHLSHTSSPESTTKPWRRPRTHDVQFSGQIRRPAILRLARITRMVLEKVPLILQGRPDRLALFDIPLTSVDDGDVTESQGDDPAGEDIDNVGSLVPASVPNEKQEQNMLSVQNGEFDGKKARRLT